MRDDTIFGGCALSLISSCNQHSINIARLAIANPKVKTFAIKSYCCSSGGVGYVKLLTIEPLGGKLSNGLKHHVARKDYVSLSK